MRKYERERTAKVRYLDTRTLRSELVLPSFAVRLLFDNYGKILLTARAIHDIVGPVKGQLDIANHFLFLNF